VFAVETAFGCGCREIARPSNAKMGGLKPPQSGYTTTRNFRGVVVFFE
jgi:hypothetical protein